MTDENRFRIHRDEPAPLVDDGVEETEYQEPIDWRGVAVLALLLGFIGYLLWLYH